MNKNLITLIENNETELFVQQVFMNKVSDKASGVYTIPLSADEEKTLLHRVLSEKKNNSWYKVLNDYMSRYALSGAAIDFLINGMKSAMAVKIICMDYEKHGYNSLQAEKICQTIKNEHCDKMFLPLLKVICKYGRSFDSNLHFLISNLDERLRSAGETSSQYADLYKKNVYEYRKQNGLLRFTN